MKQMNRAPPQKAVSGELGEFMEGGGWERERLRPLGVTGNIWKNRESIRVRRYGVVESSQSL